MICVLTAGISFVNAWLMKMVSGNVFSLAIVSRRYDSSDLEARGSDKLKCEQAWTAMGS